MWYPLWGFEGRGLGVDWNTLKAYSPLAVDPTCLQGPQMGPSPARPIPGLSMWLDPLTAWQLVPREQGRSESTFMT